MPTLRDTAAAEDAVHGGRLIRTEIERQAILAGAWEPDIVERLSADHGDSISVDAGGKVSGVEAALASHREKNPSAFMALSRVATNERLPAMQRFAESYKEICKHRDRNNSLARAVARYMPRSR